jgi:hypothetical protein
MFSFESRVPLASVNVAIAAKFWPRLSGLIGDSFRVV